MSKKAVSKRQKTIEKANDLKNVKNHYLRQCFVIMGIGVAFCVAQTVLLTSGFVVISTQFMLGMPAAIMLIAAVVMGNRAYEYRLAKNRFDQYCEEHSLLKREVG